jgi:hypothetical protein
LGCRNVYHSQRQSDSLQKQGRLNLAQDVGQKMKALTMTASQLISQHKKAPDDAGAESLLDSF